MILKLANKVMIFVSLSFLLLSLSIVVITVIKYENEIQKYKESEKEYHALINKHSNQLFETQKKLKNIEASTAYKTALMLTKYGLTDNDIKQVAKVSNYTPLDLQTSSILVSYTKKLNIPLPLQLALIDSESEFDKKAISSANARGLGQIRPITEKWILEKYGHLLGIEYNPENIFEPEYNLACSTLVLYDMFTRYGDADYHRILTEYNRGYGNARKYYERNNTYISKYSETVLHKAQEYALLINGN